MRMLHVRHHCHLATSPAELSNPPVICHDPHEELQYHGDAGKWKPDFIERAAEVFQSEVTLQYWMMNCAFKSFEGKNTRVQSMIVEDINNKDAVRPGMNVDALATKYDDHEYLSTLNAGQVVNKVNAQSDYHDRPHDKAKNKTNGSSGSSKPKRGPQRGPQEWHKAAKCHGCGQVGHIKPYCPVRTRPTPKLEAKIRQYQFHRQRLRNLPLVWRGGTATQATQPRCT